MRRMRRSGLWFVVLLALGVGGCGGGSVSGTSVTSGGGATSSASVPSASGATVAAVPSPSATSAVSAAVDVAAFVDAAREADALLRQAATLVSASVGPDAIVVDAATAAAVTAAEPTDVAVAIPAGMPDELLLPVLTAYSELVSRWAAMNRYVEKQTIPRDATDPSDRGESTVVCLSNGSAPAAAFGGDLETVVAVARSTPPLEAVAPDSLVSAELQQRIGEIDLRNSGCESCGGFVEHALATIVWAPAGDSTTTRTGTSSLPGEEGFGVGFTATYTPGNGWTIQINAC